MGLIGKIAKYGVRAVKLFPEMAFGTSAEVFGKGFKSAAKGSSIWTKVKAGAKAVETDVAKQAAAGGGGFFKRLGKSLGTLPKDIRTMVRGEVLRAKVFNRQVERALGKGAPKLLLGKSTFWAGTKGVIKALGKRMPFIGAAFTLIFDGPAIFKKFKNEGFAAGMKETTGVGVELGFIAAGATIGSAIPFVGTGIGAAIGAIVGGLVGAAAREKISPSEPAEGEGAIADLETYQKECKELGLTDEEIAYAAENGYTVDEIKELLEKEEVNTKAEQQGNRQTTQTTAKPAETTVAQNKPVTDPYGFSAILGMLTANFSTQLANTGTSTGTYNPLAATMASNPYMQMGINPFMQVGINPFMQNLQYDYLA